MSKIFRKNVVVILSILLGLVALGYILNQITIEKVLNTFSHVTFELILAFIFIQATMFLALTYRWKLILKSQGYNRVSFKNLVGYKLVGYGISFLTPSAKIGGEPVRAGLLSKKEHIDFHKALSSVVIDKTLELSANGIFTIIGFIVLLMSFVVSKSAQTLLIVFIFIFLALIFAFNFQMIRGKRFFMNLFRLLRFEKIKRFSNFMKKTIEFEDLVIKFYHEDTKYFFYTVLWSIVSWLIMFFEYKVATAMVGLNLSVFQLFLIICVVGAATIVPIPMSLGALEAGEIGLFALLSISNAAAVAVSFVVRIKDMIIAVIGLVLLGIYGLNFKEVVKETGYITKDVKRIKIETNKKYVDEK